MERLRDRVGDLTSARKRIEEVLNKEFPGIKVSVNDFHPDWDVEKCWFDMRFDLASRRETMEHIETTLGVNLKVPAGHYEYAYYDDTRKKPYVLRDRRNNKLYEVGKNFVVEHFTKGVKRRNTNV